MDTTRALPHTLTGKIALVAGATRGAGRAMSVELGRAGATVYVTGRTTREHTSEVGRTTETIEETAELVTEAGAEAGGGKGIAVPTDHLEPEQVEALVERIDREQGRLDILVNDIWGGDVHVEWDKKMWEHDLDKGMRILRLGVETHIVTSRFALPLLVRNPGGLVVEVTDGTEEYNGPNYRKPFYYDLAKSAPLRMARGLAEEVGEYGCTALCLTPGWLRSEFMLDTAFSVSEENWQDGCEQNPHFAISETPTFVGRALVALASDPQVARWNGKSLSSGGLAKEYGFTDVDGSAPDAWRYMTEVDQESKTADVTGYR
ncbi:SDR family oxidoreductase [Streptomyces sp. NBC_01381]|uniref:SDR family oxidoreductase n=1 Tax=Streptomyces sp. NBC_01381 TaxID=2903845 RepID=UPI00224F68BE|nr:SDR family oxidoreductase [Streptomyces sp. NBC_01381]MCX4667714.1 SDR family oxidoreductase [Streptomyces sp. NBC_01381]